MKKRKLEKTILFLSLIILNVISIFNMINAKLINNIYEYHWIKQLIWFIFGYTIIFIFSKIKINKILKYSKYLYIFSIALLVIVLFVGTDINGAKCWLNIFGFSFQPSEFSKLTITLYLIHIANNSKKNTLKEQGILIVKLVLIIAIPSILVFLEPDTGAILNYLIIFIIVLIQAKLNKWWYISFISGLSFLCVILFFLYFYYQDTLINILGTSLIYRIERITNFANGNSYQLENALITIGSSSFLGNGFNKVILYIPEAPTDFIFSFSIGNFGLLSGLLIIICYITIDILLINKNENKSTLPLHTFTSCYLGIFIFHQIYNIFMNIGMVPIMGIPLPFLSYGGSSTLINYVFLSIVLHSK